MSRTIPPSSPTSQIPESLLTVAQVAVLAQVCTRTVRRWIAEESLPCVRLGRSVRIAPNAVRKLLACGVDRS